MENQFQTTIKRFRSDNAKEFNFSYFFSKKGVLHQFFCVERPQKNSVVERKYLHILNLARVLLFQSYLPLKFWGECVKTVVFLMNRTPSPILKAKSPFEILYAKLSNYVDFRTFGTLCYASTLISSRHKFSPRAVAASFLGYPQGYKGYKLLNLSTKQIFISRDVKFFENIFPFKNQQSNNSDRELLDPYVTPNLITSTNLDDTDISSITDTLQHTPQPAQLDPATTIQPDIPIQEPLRRSTKVSNTPKYLIDFHCYNVTRTNKVTYPIQHHLDYSKLSNSNKHYICQISENHEPQTYSQAIKHKPWQEAISTELMAMELNKTWTIVPFPQGKKPISCKWIFKLKLHSNGTVARHKARLVAKGFTQQYGLDFQETFSPMAKITTLRLLISLAASNGWHLAQLDINNVFLNGTLSEEIFMNITQGYKHSVTKGPNPPLVCKLNRSIYGLKQASRSWFNAFNNALLRSGFKQSKHDYSLFTKRRRR